MAEEESTFDPRDSLGPEFGKINPQGTDAESLTPFEGNKPPYPDFQPANSNLTSLTRLDRAAQRYNNQTPLNNKVAPLSFQERKDGVLAQVQAIGNSKPKEYAPTYSFDSGPDSNAFYKRYEAYGSEVFNELGFHPFRDNEILYNANTTGWDDLTRSITYGWGPLFSRGFVAGPISLFQAAKGNYASDLEAASIYAEANAIGQSSKKGFGPFMVNAGLAFSYTAGIIVEAITEEVLAAMIAAPTGGVSLFAATANNLRKISKFGAGVDGIKALNKTLRKLDKAPDARKFWNSSVGRLINPLENTRDAALGIKHATVTGDNISNLSKLYRTTGGFYRDIRNVNMALAEARLEGGFVENETYKELYDEFFEEKGIAPTVEDQKEMRKVARAAGVDALISNTSLLYLSNKILLPNLLGSRRGIGRVLTGKSDEIFDLGIGRVIYKADKELAKAAKTKSRLSRGTFEWQKKGLKSWYLNVKTQPIGRTLWGGLKFFKANVTEGLQENAQDVIAEVNREYYKQVYKNPALANIELERALRSEAISKQFTARGFETFATGFMMGAYARPLNFLAKNMGILKERIFNKEAYEIYKTNKQNLGDELSAYLNELADPNSFFNNRVFGFAVQEQIENNLKDSSSKENKDQRNESIIQQVTAALQTDTMDYFYEHLRSMQDLTPAEFEEAFGFEKGTGKKYQDRIDDIIEKARSIERTYKNFKERYPNPVTPAMLSRLDKETDDYRVNAILHHAWNKGLENATFFSESFEDATSRMNQITQNFGAVLDLSKIAGADIQSLFDDVRLDSEIEMFKSQIESLGNLDKSDQTNSTKRELKTAKIKLKAYEDFKDIKDQYVTLINEKANIKYIKENPEILEEAFETKEERIKIEKDLDKKSKKFKDKELVLKTQLERAFKEEYIKPISDISKETVLPQKIDEAFEMLIDFYNLDLEAREMATYINLLSNPKEYVNHIQRTYQWMSELYENKKSVYDDMVKVALDLRENNAFINALADQGLYVDLDELNLFLESIDSGEIIWPSELYDDIKKRVYKYGSLEYQNYQPLFWQLIALKKQEKQTYPEGLQNQLDKLDKDEQDELSKLKQERTEEEIKTTKSKKGITLDAVIEKLQPQDGEYVKVTYKDGKVNKNITLYVDGEFFKQDNAQGKQLNFEQLSTNIGSNVIEAKRFRVKVEPEKKEADKIRAKYDLLRREAIAKYEDDSDKGTQDKDKGSEEYVDITYDTDIENLPSDLKAELQEAFNNSSDKIKSKYEGTEDEQLASFMKNEKKAHAIIDAYNKKQKSSADAGSTTAPEVPNLLTLKGNPVKNPETKDIKYLEKLEKNYKDYIKEHPKDKLSLKFKELLPKLRAYIDYLKEQDRPDSMKNSIELIEKLSQAQRRMKISKGPDFYQILNEDYERVTNAIMSTGLKTAFNLTGIDKFTNFYANDPDPDAYIEKLKKLKSPFTELSYKRIKAELEKLDREATTEELEKILNTSAHIEERESGTNFDAAVRELFTNLSTEFSWDKLKDTDIRINDTTVKKYSDILSEEVFNYMFGPEGKLTKLREDVIKGKYYINAEGLILYDTEAKIAGEIDLLLVDREGNIHIIDLKTGSTSVWDFYGKKSSLRNVKTEFELQQQAYKNLFFNMTGQDVSINILPVSRENVEKNTSKLLEVKLVDKLINVDGVIWYELTPGKEVVAEINELIPRKKPGTKPSDTTDIKAKKDEIERRWKEDLNIGVPIDKYVSGEIGAKNQLIKFRTYLTDVLGWEKMSIGFSNKTHLTLDYLGTELRIPAELIELGGGLANLNVDIKDVINAKYNAELDALGKKSTKGSTSKPENQVKLKTLEKMIAEVNTIKELENVSAQIAAFNTEERVTKEDIDAANELIKTRREEILAGENINLNPKNIKKGDQLFALVDIKNQRGNEFVSALDTVKVIEVNEDTKTMKVKFRRKTASFKFSEIDKLFSTEDLQKAKGTKSSEDITEDSNETFRDTVKNAGEFSKEPTEDISTKDILDDLGEESTNQCKS